MIQSQYSAKCWCCIFSERFVKINIYRKISGCHYLYKKENSVHKSSAVCIYFQCGIEDTLPNILLETLVHILSEPCFNILRTREQLGKTSKMYRKRAINYWYNNSIYNLNFVVLNRILISSYLILNVGIYTLCWRLFKKLIKPMYIVFESVIGNIIICVIFYIFWQFDCWNRIHCALLGSKK